MAEKNKPAKGARSASYALRAIKTKADLAESNISKLIHEMKGKNPDCDLFIAIRGSLDLKELKPLNESPYPALQMCHKCIYIKLGSDKIRLFTKTKDGKLYQQTCPIAKNKMATLISKIGLEIISHKTESCAGEEYSPHHHTPRFFLGVFFIAKNANNNFYNTNKAKLSFLKKKIALSRKIAILENVFLSLATNKMTQTNEELMKNYQQLLQFARNSINKAEMELKRAKLTLGQLMHFDPSNPESLTAYLEEMRAENPENLKSYKEEGMEVIEGIFDGYYMIGANQMKYPVPVNYSSKTKLIPGDVLKLKVLSDGKFIYKLIKPAERKHLRAILSKSDENKYTANTEDGKVYFLNQAAVSFYLGNPGDELYVIVNENGEGNFAAIEAIIKK